MDFKVLANWNHDLFLVQNHSPLKDNYITMLPTRFGKP